MLQAGSKSYETLIELRRKWYPEGKKVVPEDLSFLNDMAVAKWYMDDGSLAHNDRQNDRACFSTNGFSEQDVQRLCKKLNEMYGVNAVCYDSKGWNIRINAGKNNEIESFWRRIAPFVIPCMQYKLPVHHRGLWREHPGVAPERKTEELVSFEGVVESVEEVEINKRNFPFGRKGFDIETETHNFFAKGVLVHNSLMQLYFYDNKWHVATSGTPDADCNVPFGNMTFQNLFWDTWVDFGYDLPLDTDASYAFELMTKYNQIVVRHAKPRLVFHGSRNLKYGYEVHPREVSYNLNWETVKEFDFGYTDEIHKALEEMDGGQCEGFVVVDSAMNRVKLKCEDYVKKHRLVSSLSERNMLDLIRTNEAVEFLAYFPEWKDVHAEIQQKFDKLVVKTQAEYNTIKGIKNQKDFALKAKQSQVSGTLFALRAGKVASIRDSFARMNIKHLERLLGLEG